MLTQTGTVRLGSTARTILQLNDQAQVSTRLRMAALTGTAVLLVQRAPSLEIGAISRNET